MTNANEITLAIDGTPVDFVSKDSIPKGVSTGPESIVRTYLAGVHIGTIKSIDGQVVTLTNARRLWKWSGDLTLSAVATAGIKRSESCISVAVPEITLFQAIEIIPVVAGVDLSPTEYRKAVPAVMREACEAGE